MITDRPFVHGGSMTRFADRDVAGRLLARRLADYRGRDDVVVLGLPRGGVPVAAEVGLELEAPLDVCVVRKLGVPGFPELAMGAIAPGGVRVLNDDIVADLGVSDSQIEQVTAAERGELERRQRAYRGEANPPEMRGRTVILVDDGLATGATMRAAVAAARRAGAARVVVAVPVAAAASAKRLEREADDVVCVMVPHSFASVGQWYDEFTEVSDREVCDLLHPSTRRSPTDAVV